MNLYSFIRLFDIANTGEHHPSKDGIPCSNKENTLGNRYILPDCIRPISLRSYQISSKVNRKPLYPLFTLDFEYPSESTILPSSERVPGRVALSMVLNSRSYFRGDSHFDK